MRSFFKIKLIRYRKYLTNSSITFVAVFWGNKPRPLHLPHATGLFFSRNHPLCCETWETFGLDLKTWWETEYLTFRWDDLGFHLAACTQRYTWALVEHWHYYQPKIWSYEENISRRVVHIQKYNSIIGVAAERNRWRIND